MTGNDLVPSVLLRAEGNGRDDTPIHDALNKLIHILIQLDLEWMVREIVDLIQRDLMDSWQFRFRSACIIHE